MFVDGSLTLVILSCSQSAIRFFGVSTCVPICWMSKRRLSPNFFPLSLSSHQVYYFAWFETFIKYSHLDFTVRERLSLVYQTMKYRIEDCKIVPTFRSVRQVKLLKRMLKRRKCARHLSAGRRFKIWIALFSSQYYRKTKIFITFACVIHRNRLRISEF